MMKNTDMFAKTMSVPWTMSGRSLVRTELHDRGITRDGFDCGKVITTSINNHSYSTAINERLQTKRDISAIRVSQCFQTPPATLETVKALALWYFLLRRNTQR